MSKCYMTVYGKNNTWQYMPRELRDYYISRKLYVVCRANHSKKKKKKKKKKIIWLISFGVCIDQFWWLYMDYICSADYNIFVHSRSFNTVVCWPVLVLIKRTTTVQVEWLGCVNDCDCFCIHMIIFFKPFERLFLMLFLLCFSVLQPLFKKQS